MRPYLLLSSVLIAMAVAACSTTPEERTIVHEMRMPLVILRAEGEDARMGDVALFAGRYDKDSLFSFSVYFKPVGDQLGAPDTVAWSVRFGAYCRDRPSWLQSVVIGPSGQVWRGFRVEVPAGPDRAQDWSSGATGAYGPGAQPTPGLLEAMAQGGPFILALEDDEGQRWNAVTIDTLTPRRRQHLFAANLKAFQAAAADAPVTGDGMLIAVQSEIRIPFRPRPCPTDG